MRLLPCSLQITAVCDFFTYARYITQGLVKSDGEYKKSLFCQRLVQWVLGVLGSLLMLVGCPGQGRCVLVPQILLQALAHCSAGLADRTGIINFQFLLCPLPTKHSGIARRTREFHLHELGKER